MGFPLNGEWREDSDFPRDAAGRFARPASPFRNWVTPDVGGAYRFANKNIG